MEVIPVYQPASPQAQVIVGLFNIILAICGVVLAIVTGLITYCLVRFRAKPDSPEPSQTVGNKRIEFIWTAVPFLLVVWMFILTGRAMNRSDPVPSKLDPDLIVIGHQWWWEVRYPKAGVVTANEIHVPMGAKLLVRLDSADVIHDFWAPRLGRKMDMVPGHPNYLWLQPGRAGTYQGACAEYCGTQHAWMRFDVIAQAPAEFAAWLEQQKQPAPAPVSAEAQRGLQVLEQFTCANCHQVNGTSARAQVAPDLTHLASRRALAGGVALNTPEELARWLKDPQQLKPGSLMPKVQLTDEQVRDLVAYFNTLK